MSGMFSATGAYGKVSAGVFLLKNVPPLFINHGGAIKKIFAYAKNNKLEVPKASEALMAIGDMNWQSEQFSVTSFGSRAVKNVAISMGTNRMMGTVGLGDFGMLGGATMGAKGFGSSQPQVHPFEANPKLKDLLDQQTAVLATCDLEENRQAG